MKRSRLVNAGLAVALVATGAGIYAAVGTTASAKGKPATVDVSTGTVLASVSASGTVQPAQQLNLNFLSSGVLLEVDVKVGDKVTAGQVLAKIDPTTAQQNLTVAQAQLTAAQDNLTSLQSASTSTTTTAATPTTSSGSSQAAAQAQAQVQQAQAALQRDSAKLAQAQGQLAGAQASFQQATAKVNKDLAFQQQCLANPATPPSGGLTCATVGTQVQIDTASQASAQAAVTAAGVNVATAQQAVTADQSALATATAAASAAKSTGSGGSTSAATTGSGGGSGGGSSSASSAGSIAQAEATVTSDQINVANAQKALDATTMTAPADGTVSSLNGIVGQTVSAGSSATSVASSGTGSSGTGSTSGGGGGGGAATSAASSSSTSSSSSSSSAFITLTDLNALQVSASFTESDATKLVVGQKAIVTYSALPNVQTQGVLAQIATTSTTSNGVVSFTTLINLDQVPDGLKPGMSATAQVIVGEADNTVFVPASAVTGTGTTGTVTVVKDDGSTAVTQVTIGLRGDTTVEITSGLEKGQKVVRSTTVATTGSTPTGRTGGVGGAGGGTLTGGGGFGGGGAGRIGG